MAKQAVHLLIWEEKPEHSERHISALKNQGIAVREKNISSITALEQALSEKRWDILILVLNDETLSIIEKAKQLQTDLAIFTITHDDNYQSHLDLLQKGVLHTVPRQDIAALDLLIPRELHNLQQKQRLIQYKSLNKELEQRCRNLMDSSRDAIAYIHEGMHIYTNQSYLDMFKIDEIDAESMPILDFIHKDNREALKKVLRIAINGQQEEPFDCIARRADDSEFKAAIKLSPGSIDAEKCLQMVIRDLTMEEELSKKIEEISSTDLVTGLKNRHYFTQQLKNTLDTLEDNNSHLLFIKLDNFRELQQKLGIAGCDIILRDVASIIQNSLNQPDFTARFSDEIFTAIIPNQANEEIAALCQTICNNIKQTPIEIEDKQVNTSCSIGITAITKRHKSPPKLLAETERACNIAHQEGGSKIHQLHTLEASPSGQTEHSTSKIKQALENNQFRLVFQPIVSLHAEPGDRYEVLLRMLSDTGEEISPANFLPTAADAGLMSSIDRWVIKHSISTLAVKRRSGINLRLFIKLSEDSILDSSLAGWINTYLKAARLPGDCLIFELSEELILSNPEPCESFMKEIKQLHCETAIDHVMGLLDSVEYVTHLDANYIKIDGSLISEVSNDKATQDIAKKIASLAQANNKQTIAEFVHDANTLAILWQYGINFVQGYYLQKPAITMDYNFAED